ncbi:MAG: hypothetical protein A3B96_03930 [Candidatus Spechtbacteria bacterium RIFCSPHIGHO2_02_FULL_43_15b]|nr:MAG: hypothetical protein A3B96_03930 [Candidatus Spechtbacteria bacterium RIFCSPHIGHO2_02_FULL_43_15b]
MERFEKYRPKILHEVSELDMELSPGELGEFVDVAMLEAGETLDAISIEAASLETQYFSLDAFYELQAILAEYEGLIASLDIKNKELRVKITGIRDILRDKNPISNIAENNGGYVLVHSSDLKSLRNLVETKNEVAEVCTTANSLRIKGDIFQSSTKSIEAGFIYDPKQATAWFSKDVGSHTHLGKRVLERRFQEFIATSLDDALKKQSGQRVEVWVDAAKISPVAILIISEARIEDCIRMGREFGLPVLYNSHFFEQEFGH